MVNKLRITLSKKITDILVELPEQGMGYQIIDIQLKNGKWLMKKIVLNASILEIDKSEEIKSEEIALVKLHSD